MPDDTTSNAHVIITVAPADERQNKTPTYVLGIVGTRVFLSRIKASCPICLTAQIKGKILIIVPYTAEGLRTMVSALRFPDAGEGVTFHTFALLEDRCVRLLVKNLGKLMPEDIVKEELEIFAVGLQAVLHLRSGCRGQETFNAQPLTPNFIVSVARGPDVARLRSLIELRALRVSVETFNHRNGPLQCKRCQRFSHTQRYSGYAPRLASQGSALPRSSNLSAAAVEGIMRPFTVSV
jgi:hypothetical protein